MLFSSDDSTPNRGLSATRQAIRELGDSQKFLAICDTAKQLTIWESPQKPQIVSIPGIPPKERNRYRVLVGDEVLGDRLTLDEALNLANGGEA